MDDIKTYRLELAEPIDPHQTDFLTLWEPKNNWIYQFDGASPEIVYYVNGRYFRGQGGTKRQAHKPGEELVPIVVAQAEYNRTEMLDRRNTWLETSPSLEDEHA